MKHMFTVHADDPFPYRGGHLRPATDEALAWVRRMNPGNIIECDVVRPRSQQHHRLFFALLKIVSDNHPDGASVDMLLDIIKLGVGHTTLVKLPQRVLGRIIAQLMPWLKQFIPSSYLDITLRGDVYYAVPKSISFAAMDEDEFGEFFNKAVDYIIAEILPGIDKDALTREVYDMAGIPQSLLEAEN